MSEADASATRIAPGAAEVQITTQATKDEQAASEGERKENADHPSADAAAMGKTTDGGEGVGTDPTHGTPAQDAGNRQRDEEGPDASKPEDNVIGGNNEANDDNAADNKGAAGPAGDAAVGDGGDDEEVNANDVSANPQGDGGVAGDVKEDDVNFNDSVSNVKSQPGKARGEAKSSKDVKFVDQDKSAETSSMQPMSQTPRPKRTKKGIFVSYSPDAGFLERRFVVEMVRQLKENNLAEDIWFDKDEKNTDSPCWFSLRMEAVEKCRAAILILSDSYFSCPVSVYEGKVLLERQSVDPNSIKVFSVLFSQVENAEIPKQYLQVMTTAVDLATENNIKKSSAEKTSIVIGAIMEELEKFATINAPPMPFTPPDTEFTGEYKKKKICQWNAADLQEWLFNLGIKEFYRQVCNAV